MRVPYRDLVQKASGFEPDIHAAKMAEKLAGRLGPASLRFVGQIASYASSIGLDPLEVARVSAIVARLDPDIRHSVIVHLGESDPVRMSIAEPEVSTDLEIIATVACTPSAFIGMCIPQASTVALLRSMSNRALKQPWNSEWFRKETFRLANIGGPPNDQDIARNAIVARMDTMWSGMAAECVYSMLRDGKVRIGERLWIEAVDGAELNGWMYESLLEKLHSISWLQAESFSQLQYRGVVDFTAALQANKGWAAMVFDGEDLLEASSDPSILVDWFASLAILGHATPFYDNSFGRWMIPFMSAREGVGVLMLSAELWERPDALLRGLHLPGVEWVRKLDHRIDRDRMTIEVDGKHIPVMELSEKQAVEMAVFYLCNEIGERMTFWHIAKDGSEERGQ